jgi:hypothetical protein
MKTSKVITIVIFNTHVFNSLLVSLEGMLKNQQNNSNTIIEEVIEVQKEHEKARNIRIIRDIITDMFMTVSS